jgi:hypothetical protein
MPARGEGSVRHHRNTANSDSKQKSFTRRNLMTLSWLSTLSTQLKNGAKTVLHRSWTSSTRMIFLLRTSMVLRVFWIERVILRLRMSLDRMSAYCCWSRTKAEDAIEKILREGQVQQTKGPEKFGMTVWNCADCRLDEWCQDGTCVSIVHGFADE